MTHMENKEIAIKNMHKFAVDRGGVCCATTYTNSHAKYEWICENGHRFLKSWQWAQKGSWCPYCSGGLKEETCRVIIQHLTGKIFVSTRSVLKNNWQLDGYCKELGCAFEYNGEQHYKFNSYFHRTESSFWDNIKRDQEKLLECKNLSIKLIVIPFTAFKKNIFDYIKIELIKNNIPIVNDSVPCIIISNPKLKKCQEFAQKKGGILLSTVYSGEMYPLLWQCKQKHDPWKASWNNTKKGSWCPHCANQYKNSNRKYTIEDVQKVVNTHNYVCLSQEYINARTPLEFKCLTCEKTYFSTFDNLQRKKKWGACCEKHRLV